MRFAKEGYQVAITANRDAEGLAETRRLIEPMHVTCETFLADAASYTDMSDVITALLSKWGHIDILVNNAGIASIGLFTDQTPEEYERMLSVNLLSVLHCCHLVTPSMVAAKSGRILNISSIWGICGASCEAVYSASKGGVNAFTRALAKELAPSGISVNAIACGVIDTEMNRSHLCKEELDSLAESIPTGRMAQPEEVADAAWKLLQTSSYLTGQIITFDGGFL